MDIEVVHLDGVTWIGGPRNGKVESGNLKVGDTYQIVVPREPSEHFDDFQMERVSAVVEEYALAKGLRRAVAKVLRWPRVMSSQEKKAADAALKGLEDRLSQALEKGPDYSYLDQAYQNTSNTWTISATTTNAYSPSVVKLRRQTVDDADVPVDVGPLVKDMHDRFGCFDVVGQCMCTELAKRTAVVLGDKLAPAIAKKMQGRALSNLRRQVQDVEFGADGDQLIALEAFRTWLLEQMGPDRG